MTERLKENYGIIKERIAAAARESGRRPEEIRLLAATKTVPAAVINYAISKGLDYIGENRVQELLGKYDSLDLDSVQLDFIGHLQTNKAKQVVGKVGLIQSLDSLKLAQTIDQLAEKLGITQDVLIEINIGEEENKYGVVPAALDSFLEEVCRLRNIRIRGLMTIPPISEDSVRKRKYFCDMYRLFIDKRHKKMDNVSMDFLSMGMSDDYELAILEGANIVRVGSLLFGKRIYK